MVACRRKAIGGATAQPPPPARLPPWPLVSLHPVLLRTVGVLLALGFVATPTSLLAEVRTDARGTRIAEPAPAPPSRWQAERDALDQAFRSHLSTATTPRERWIEATWGDADPWVRADALADVRRRVPDETLYIASLAIACLAPLQPLPAACDGVDRLADWALRDADNGVPTLLLADRARRRNNGAAMVAYLGEAATRLRFDDYADRAAWLVWEAIRDLPGAASPAARVELANDYIRAHPSYAAQRIASLCRAPAPMPDPAGAACLAAGHALAGRAATWALRSAGAHLAERSSDAGTRTAAQQQVSMVQRRAFECTEAGQAIVARLQAADAATRAGAVGQWETRLREQARFGEATTCAAG